MVSLCPPAPAAAMVQLRAVAGACIGSFRQSFRTCSSDQCSRCLSGKGSGTITSLFKEFAMAGVRDESSFAMHGGAADQFSTGSEAECHLQLQVHGKFR